MIAARAVWFESPGVASVREEAIADPGPGEVLVRAICSGISAGTERLVLSGEVPEEARAAMALPLMRGGFDLPIAYGYALVGAVEAAGPGVDPARIGERVFLLHPHQDRLIAPASALRPLPTAPPPPRLVLAPSLETAINVIWDTEIALGDRVIVTGLGVVGLLIARLAAKAGASSVLAVDPDPARRSLAIALGASAAAPAADPSAIAEADALVEISGDPAALARLVEHAGPEARVVVASWYGRRAALLPLGGRFHPHRVMMRSSQVARIDPRKSGRWDAARRWSLVCDRLHDAELDRLIAAPVPLADAPMLYAELASGARWSPPQRVLDAARGEPGVL
jgi:2-desacetyl-2-hydroxyethyl bacteriochlorophyllide A dehydrogenase